MNCIGLYIENYFGSFLSFTMIFTPNMRTIYCECWNFVKFSLELQWIEVERKCKTRNRCVNALLNRRLISSAIVYIRVASLSLYTSVHCYTVTEIEYFRIDRPTSCRWFLIILFGILQFHGNGWMQTWNTNSLHVACLLFLSKRCQSIWSIWQKHNEFSIDVRGLVSPSGEFRCACTHSHSLTSGTMATR